MQISSRVLCELGRKSIRRPPPGQPQKTITVKKQVFSNLYGQDENGCETCECEEVVCPAIMCTMYCEHGFQKDPDTGCDICACSEEPGPCPAVICAAFCPNGWKTVRFKLSV